GSSPEMLVRVTGSKLEYRPIAGTHPRGKDEAEDRQLEEKMLSDEKERAEHVMLVDLGRNDLGRVSEYGSVKVKDLMYVERYSHHGYAGQEGVSSGGRRHCRRFQSCDGISGIDEQSAGGDKSSGDGERIGKVMQSQNVLKNICRAQSGFGRTRLSAVPSRRP